MRRENAVVSAFVPIHREGWRFIAAAVLGGWLLGMLWEPLFWIGLGLAAWIAYFFRDPKRTTPDHPDWVVAPADGIVVSTAERLPPVELELPATPLPCVSIFLNIFDVHINRTPVPARIVRQRYHPGAFVNAALDKASDENERQAYRLETASGKTLAVVQIAGLVARRIRVFVREGQSLEAGQRIGLIRFGSRCDVYLPEGTVPQVLVGQRTVSGETVIARLDQAHEPLPARRH